MKKNILISLLVLVGIVGLASCTDKEKTKYTITLNPEGGVVNITTIEADANSTILLPHPTKSGYQFLGWFYQGDAEWTASTEVTVNVNLYAKWQAIAYDITYILNDGTNNQNNPSSYSIETLPIVLSEPTKEGYVFNGWYINNQLISAITPDTEGNIIVEARFVEEYNITYTGINANTVDNPNKYCEGDTPIELQSPSRVGYTFAGWALGSRIITRIPSGTTGDLTLNALWDPQSIVITYNLDGGVNNDLNPTTILYESAPFTLEDPTKEGYYFKGWLYNDEIITQLPTNNLDSIDLTATWEKIPIYHDIIYVLNGGTLPVDSETRYQEGVMFTLAIPTRTQYTFEGWFTNSSYSGGSVTIIGDTESDHKTFYAKWNKIVVTSNIAYHLDGGDFQTAVPSTYEEGESITLPIPIKEGYVFKGWYSSSTLSGTPITQISQNATGDLDFYASWESEIVTYTINYNLNGGSWPRVTAYQTRTEMVDDFMNDYNAFNSTNITTPDFFEESYKHAPLEHFFNSPTYNSKWAWMKAYIIKLATNENYSGLTDLTDESSSYHNNFLRANIHAFINTSYRSLWPISLDFTNPALNNGFWDVLPGSIVNVVTSFTVDTDDIVLVNPIRNEFTFLGWYDDNDQLVTVISKGTTEDINITAKYQTIYETYTIEYVTNGGQISGNAAVEYISKDTILLPKATKNGYTFGGWFTTSTFTGTSVSTITEGSTGNKVFYAKWNIVNYSISYNLNDGTVVNNPVIYNIESELITLLPTSKVGYSFTGWFTNEGVKVETILTGSTGNYTLNAVFIAVVDPSIKYTVTFINALGVTVNTQEVSHGAKVSEIALGSLESLDLSWYNEGKIYDFDQQVTKNLTLYAKWSVIDEIMNQTFVGGYAFENVVVYTSYSTAGGYVNVRWTSSNTEYLNLVTGVVNPGYENTPVTITAVFTKGSTTINFASEIIVKAVQFRDLSTFKPVFAYVYSNMGSYTLPEVSLKTIDVINYSFARVTSGGGISLSENNYRNYIPKVIEGRKKGIRVLLCIGGYGASCAQFSDAALTKESREAFAKNLLDVVETYHFDGVDVDWEYPGYGTGRDVSIDRPNYTLLMAEIRRQFKAANPEYLVTAAVPGGKYGYTRYELANLNNILDYVHLMTYDLQDSNRTTHHTGLYTGSYTPHGSVEQTIKQYIASGVSKNKLVVGIAFYGRYYVLNSFIGTGIGSNNISSGGSSIRYTLIYNNYLSKLDSPNTTVKRYWDDTTKAPYLYDSATRTWISYDDKDSIKYKCQYTKDNDLGGVMFWDYGEDLTYQLIQAIHDNFR